MISYKQSLLISLLIFIPHFSHTNNSSPSLVIEGIDADNPHWTFEGNVLREKENGKFAQLIEEQNHVIEQLWQDIIKRLEEAVDVSEEELINFLEDEDFIQSYVHHQEVKLEKTSPQTIPSELVDPSVTKFITGKMKYLQVNKPYNLLLQKDMNLLSTSFGADAWKHFLVCNERIYNRENIRDFFTSLYTDKTNFFIEPDENIHKTRCIELPNLLHLGIVEAASGIIHQSHLLIFLITNYEFNEQSIPEDIIQEIFNFLQFRSFMESTLQTKNPLEAARFLQIKEDLDSKHKYKDLWDKFSQDLADCYNEEDLEFYESAIMHIKRNAHN